MNPNNFNNDQQDNKMNGHISLEKNDNFNDKYATNNIYEEPPRANFTKSELNSAILPNKIAKEIRHEKFRIFLINFSSIILMILSLFFILAYYVAKPIEINGDMTKWNIPTNYVPHPAFMFILLGIALFMFIMSTIQYAHVITSVNKYKGDILMGRNTIPYFLIKDYKSLISRTVYINWISIALYVISGILIGIFIGLQKGWPNKFSFRTELIVIYILLSLAFAFHIITLITIKYRKGNLNSYFGHELISGEESRAISKRANKICLITFLVIISIILIFILIPYLIIRKRKGLPLMPKK